MSHSSITLRLLTLLLCTLLPSALAQSSSSTSSQIIYPTTAAASATALAGGSGYTYVGCWNETTGFVGAGGVRALSGGTQSVNNTMTTADCLAFCAQGYGGQTMQYAGLEYGRECYCGAYLSALSDPLNATAKCDYACNGNASEICGGELAISLYNLTASSSSTDKTGIGWSLAAGQPMWYAVAAFVTFVVAALL